MLHHINGTKLSASHYVSNVEVVSEKRLLTTDKALSDVSLTI